MQIKFADKEIEDAVCFCDFHGKYKKLKSAAGLKKDLFRVINYLRAARNFEELKFIKSLNYEHLKYDKVGLSSVRIGFKTKYRLIFSEDEFTITITLIEISEHYGDK